MSAFLVILLTILKVTGIVLLCIIGPVLFVLLIVLFVPVRYKADGFYKDSDYNVKAKASWLLHVVTVSFDLKASKKPVIKVFGIKLKGKKKKDEEEGETAEETTEDVTKEAKEETKEEAVEEIKEESTDEQFSEETATDEEDKRSEKKDKRSKDKKEFKSESVYDKIKGYVDILKSDEFKESFALVKKQLCRLLKAILPRKWEINASLGFEDPSLTGYVCAVSGAMYMWFRKHIHIVGDFDEEKIDAKAYFKGRIYIVVLVYVFLRVWFNKKIRHTIELFR